VYASGRLSQTVEDRVACATELYHAGTVRRVLVSGCIERVNFSACAMP
jgi:vancomycin permeability regulator SanA